MIVFSIGIIQFELEKKAQNLAPSSEGTYLFIVSFKNRLNIKIADD